MDPASPTPPYRLPLPKDEPVTPADALRRARVHQPAVVEVLPGDLASEMSPEKIPDSFDALLWRPVDRDLEHFFAQDLALDFEGWRDLVGERKLLVDIEAGREREIVQALSEAGFVIQRRDLLTDAAGSSPRVWMVAKADNYRVRTCRQDDEEAILELFTPLFHSERSAEHWRWKYLDNPWGQRWISLAVSEDGELAAHYAGYPVPFVRWPDAPGGRRQDLLAVQIGDTMTTPEHRKVGLGWTSLLGRAVRHHFACFGRGGVAFYYGFNTGKIRNFNFRFIKGRWAGTVGFYRRPATPQPPAATRRRWFGRRRHKAFRIEPFAEELGRELGRELDEFMERVGPRYRLLVRRDAAWLRWRYAICPDQPGFFAIALRRKGRLVGWGVFRRHHDAATGGAQLRWVDSLFDPEHVDGASALLELALAQPEAQGVHETTAWFSPRPAWWLDVLDGLGFERAAEPDDLGLIYLPFDEPETDALFQEVYYTWGDSDLT